MDRIGTDEKKVYEILSEKSDAEREKLKEAYEKITGSTLEYDLAHEFSGVELDKAMDLLNTGEVRDVVRVRFIGEGFEGDLKGLFAILRTDDRERLEQLKVDFKKWYKEDLKDWLIDELTGRDELEAILALRGKLTTPEERIEHLQLRLEYESRFFARLSQGTLLESDTEERAEKILVLAAKKLQIYRSDNDEDPSLSQEEVDDIERLLRFVELDLDTLNRNARPSRPKPSLQEENKVEEITP